MPSEVMGKQSAVQYLGHAFLMLEICAAAAVRLRCWGKLLKKVGRVYNGTLNGKSQRNQRCE
jgi:hypothetical protein